MKKEKNQTGAVRQRKIQWHPAFVNMTEIELGGDRGSLTFEAEWSLKRLPHRMDLLIRKTDPDRQVKKSIGNIFKKYNLVQYKSPGDYISINDYFYLHGSASWLRAEGYHDRRVSEEEITLTFVAYRYPEKLIRYLTRERKYIFRQHDAGIYYVLGNHYAMQLVVLPELNPEEYMWLTSLATPLTEEVQAKLMEEYFRHGKETAYQSAMEFIIQHNENMFTERKDNDMCRTLLEIYKPELMAMVREEFIEEVKPEIIEEVKLEIIEKARPEIIEEARPEIIEKARPEIIEKARSEIIEKARPEIIEKARPGIIEKARPEIIEEARPEIIEEARSEIIEKARPGIVQETKREVLEKVARSLKNILDTKTIASYLELSEEAVMALEK